MPKRIMLLLPTILAAVVAVALTARSDRAESATDNCIAKPNATAHPGGHWYYRVDRATKRHCWYLGPEGQKRQATPLKRPPPRPVSQPTAEKPAEAVTGRNPEPITTGENAEAITNQKDVGATFSMRWHGFPKWLVSFDLERASMSNSYADEQSTTASQDDMPLIRPVLTAADHAAVARPPESIIKFAHMLALVAAALAFAAITVRTIYSFSEASLFD